MRFSRHSLWLINGYFETFKRTISVSVNIPGEERVKNFQARQKNTLSIRK